MTMGASSIRAAGPALLAALAVVLAAPARAAEHSDPAQASDEARRACASGEPEGCYRVGLLLEQGTGADLPLAWKAFHQACRMGSRAACAHRLPTPPEPAAELGWLCDQGFTSRCLALALQRQRRAGRGARVEPLLRRACLWGTGMGCFLLAEQSRDRRPGTLAIYYRGACNYGVSGGCVALARLLLAGRAVWRDLRTARWAYQIGCQQGDRDACAGLRDPALAEARNSPDDPEEAARLCQGGDLQACADAGLTFTLGEHADRERAAPMLERSCAGGNQEGCSALAILDDLRDGDCRRAAPLLERACAAGVPQACGVRAFRCGLREPREEPRRFLAHLELGCIGGDHETCEHLAVYRWAGEAVPRDGVEGTMLAQNACENGWLRSCPQAGWYFMSGAPGIPDPRSARLPLERGCDGGEARSCELLGRLYRDGEGGARDLDRGRALFEKACQLGEQDGCSALERLDGAAGPAPAQPEPR
jgi:TPR repeat protein